MNCLAQTSDADTILCVGHWATVSAMAFQFISDLKMGVVHNGSVTVITKSIGDEARIATATGQDVITTKYPLLSFRLGQNAIKTL